MFMLLVFHELLEANRNLTQETHPYVRDCEVREGLIWPSWSRKVALHCTSLQIYHYHLAYSFFIPVQMCLSQLRLRLVQNRTFREAFRLTLVWA